jgi:hypothetical protein
MLINYLYDITNKVMVMPIVNAQTTLFQLKIFCPSNTPNGSKLNIAIHALKFAPMLK